MIFLLIKPVTKINRPENAFYTLLAAEKMFTKSISKLYISIFTRKEDPSNSYRAGLRGLSQVNALLCIRGVEYKAMKIKVDINKEKRITNNKNEN